MSEVDAENLIAVLKEFIDNKIYYPDIGETKEYEVKSLTSHDSVSYTHLDVYKRQTVITTKTRISFRRFFFIMLYLHYLLF